MPTAVIAVDFATHALEIVSRAAPVLRAMNANAVLLYQIEVIRSLSPETILHPAEAPEGVKAARYLEADARERLKPLVSLLQAEGVPVELRLGHGPVVPGIVACAEALDAAVIVVGCDVKAGLGRLFQGSFTDDVLRAATVPVLVIRGRGPAAGRSGAREQVEREVDG